MTKKVKTVRTVVGDEEDEKPPDEKHSMDDEAMEEAARDFADSEQLIQLHRYDPTIGGRPRLLGGLSPAEFNGLYVMERFGGGRYFGRWKKKDGSYKRYYFDIEGPSKVQTFQEAKEARAEPEPGPYRFLGARDENGDPIQAGGQGISAVDILRIIAETRKEAREEMRMMIDMLRPVSAPPDATEKVFSLVEKIVPLIAQGGGDGSGGNPWLFALAQLKEPIMKAVDTIHLAVTKGAPAPAPAPEVGKRPVPLPSPSRTEPEPAPAKEPGPQDEEAMLIESFRPYMGILTRAASVGGQPENYCEMILDLVPPIFYDRLRAWLLKPGCLDDLAKLDEKVNANQVWWESLRGLLLETLNEELGHGVRSVQPESNPDPSGGSPAPSKPGA